MELETRLRGIKLREAQPVHGSVTLTRAAACISELLAIDKAAGHIPEFLWFDSCLPTAASIRSHGCASWLPQLTIATTPLTIAYTPRPRAKTAIGGARTGLVALGRGARCKAAVNEA
jgi:hypothetical protein